MKSSTPEIQHCTALIGRRDKGSALIEFLHAYGRDPVHYSDFVHYTFRALITNCYWGGNLGELGMHCDRCFRRMTCKHTDRCVHRYPVPAPCVTPTLPRNRKFW